MGDAGDSAWGDTDVEPDAQCPETPRTADILTDEPFQRYQYRLDDFGVSFNSVPLHMCVCSQWCLCVCGDGEGLRVRERGRECTCVDI